VLANLFLHYAFDVWMAREFPTVRFERYVDDAVVHCVSESQARKVGGAIAERMVEVGLRLHPAKTRIVYCKDGKRRGAFAQTAFTFLGYTFRPRGARDRNGRMFLSFSPAISRGALKKLGATVRSWRLHQRTGESFTDLARKINPIVRGLDELLRCLLQIGAVFPPVAHQRRPDALGPQEVPTAAGTPPSPEEVAGGHRTGTPASSRTGLG
jgi:hypothetical protein